MHKHITLTSTNKSNHSRIIDYIYSLTQTCTQAHTHTHTQTHSQTDNRTHNYIHKRIQSGTHTNTAIILDTTLMHPQFFYE